MPSKFKFSLRSYPNLSGVHPLLIVVAYRALQLSSVDFGVTEGVRTLGRQHSLYNQGKSRTLNSRHIPGADGLGKAIDVMAYIDGKGTWDWRYYEQIAAAFKQASQELNIAIDWGGNWTTFKDGVHFELSRKDYP